MPMLSRYSIKRTYLLVVCSHTRRIASTFARRCFQCSWMLGALRLKQRLRRRDRPWCSTCRSYLVLHSARHECQAFPADRACYFPLSKRKGAELANDASRAGLIEATRRRLGSLALGVAMGAVAFTRSVLGAETAPAGAPVVSAAASTKTALDAVAAAWKADTGKAVSIAYASSAALAKQIEQGAPADIFISADLKWMDYLENSKLIRAGTRRDLFGNKLVLIEPSDADVKLEIAKGL